MSWKDNPNGVLLSDPRPSIFLAKSPHPNRSKIQERSAVRGRGRGCSQTSGGRKEGGDGVGRSGARSREVKKLSGEEDHVQPRVIDRRDV